VADGSGDLDLDSLSQTIGQQTGKRFKCPRRLVLFDALPPNTDVKVQQENLACADYADRVTANKPVAFTGSRHRLAPAPPNASASASRIDPGAANPRACAGFEPPLRTQGPRCRVIGTVLVRESTVASGSTHCTQISALVCLPLHSIGGTANASANHTAVPGARVG